MLELHLIIIFMIMASLIAVEVKDLLSSVVAIGAVGIGLCMAFLTLKAPDLAIMQLVVEILSLVILVRATIRKDIPFSTSGRWALNTAITIVFMAVFLTAAFFTLKALPAFGNAIMKTSKFYIENSVAKTGSKNVVAAIMADFRAYDTLGEVAVLFTAIVGVLAVARSIGRAKGH
jgi:multisubunit Na+/H+ antiporter MnhB subunit